MVLYLHVWEKANLLLTLIWQTQLTFIVFMKTLNELNVFLTWFILCLKNVLCCSPLPYGATTVVSIMNWGKVISIHLIMIRKVPFLSNYLLLIQKENLLQELSCLHDLQISACLLMKQSRPYYLSRSRRL